MEDSITDVDRQMDLAKKKLSGARQGLALDMLQKKRADLLEEYKACPSEDSLYGLSACASVLLQNAASVQVGPEAKEAP